MLSEPLLASGEIGHRALHEEPELGRVVSLDKMDELVHHDVLDDARWKKDRPPVKVELLARAAGAPAVP